MKLILDTHTHTLKSDHAYSTIIENAQAAANAGMQLLCTTDHTPSLPDSPGEFNFINYHVLPRELHGVKMLYGAELNIMDYEGTVDLPERILKKQDICIASFHTVCTAPGTKAENTHAYLKAMENPYVSVIGHPDDGNVPVDMEELVLAAKKNSILLEVNNSSLAAAYYRKNTKENLEYMLQLCMKYHVIVSVGTDAHFASSVGRFEQAQELFAQVGFPEELVANTSLELFFDCLDARKKAVGR